MPVFAYTTKDMQGETHKGEVESADQYQAAQLLRRKRLIVISLKVKDETKQNFWEKILSRISFDDLVVTTRQLATMIQSGLILSESLDILSEQQSNKKLQRILENVSSDIKGGLDFATALEKHPDVFPPLYSKLVRAGQVSGKMDTVLLELANNLEKEREFRSKIRGAMVYPIVVLSMMVVVMLIMIFFVMPKLMGLYQESGLQLPLPTRIIITITSLVINFWWALLLVLIVLIILGRRFLATPEGKLMFDKTVLRIPVVGKVSSLVILTSFTRNFALLISSGLSILESIKIVGEIVGNITFKKGLDTAYQGVERGLPFSTQLLGLAAFPKIVGQMAKTGEETGRLDEIMFKLADYFEGEADRSLKNITTLIEPIILVILGVGVALLVISIILPIYQLTTSVK